jgi:hypothetical protein
LVKTDGALKIIAPPACKEMTSVAWSWITEALITIDPSGVISTSASSPGLSTAVIRRKLREYQKVPRLQSTDAHPLLVIRSRDSLAKR